MINWSGFKVVGRELDYLIDAFQSGWVSGGAYVEKLEKELEGLFPGSTALAVSNGTSALQLAFQTLDVRPGDHVIVPAFCFQAAGNVLRQLGAVPVFCDVDPLHWNQTVQTLQTAQTFRTVGVVVVHNYGAAAPIREICAWAREQGIWVIEDCAEAWFTQHDSRYVGQYGDVATFSMHATKTISCGEGGAVLVNDPARVAMARLMRSHGLDRQKVQYLHEIAGNNYRLSNLLAAIACAQLEERDGILRKQRENSEAYRRLLAGHWAIELQASHPESEDYLWAVAVSIWLDGLTVDRDDLLRLLKKAGIEARPGFYPASSLPYNDDLDFIHSDVADRLHKTIIVLPCALTLGMEEIGQVCTTLCALIEQHRKPSTAYCLQDARHLAEGGSLIQAFYNRLAEGRKSFRYFDKRSVAVIQSHLATLLLEVEGRVVGYGHLDPDGSNVWLGIALADGETGKGWGRIMMLALLKAAAALRIPVITLRVDNDNAAAIRLYRSFGFETVAGSETESSLTMILHQ